MLPVTHRIVRWVDFGAIWWWSEKSLPLPKVEPRSSSPERIVSDSWFRGFFHEWRPRGWVNALFNAGLQYNILQKSVPVQHCQGVITSESCTWAVAYLKTMAAVLCRSGNLLTCSLWSLHRMLALSHACSIECMRILQKCRSSKLDLPLLTFISFKSS
jgi:hypothetical protein